MQTLGNDYSVTHIYVDADGCPVKDEIYRVAKRYGVPVTLVANSSMRTPDEDGIEFVLVDDGFDAADDWIVEQVEANEIVVTTDILPWTDDLKAALNKLPADRIHLSITPHGLTGPLATVPGNNLTSCARTGWCHINGLTGEPPLQLPIHQTGYIAGVAGFVGALAALYRSSQE